ncbi:hypothetical protein [Pseudophaeobacter flagellatus]|uniref:hypothetical protein n=1 Tax=Pseudophaeobacter flagellatus TaxID=2899119 RepID=UPI001E29D50C|nr:hypothetical protein [Pseudophaeobacter flagellatus]
MSIFEDDFLKIKSRQNKSDHESNSILLSFTGIGHAMGDLNVQKPEFFGAGRSFDNIIFIIDKTRSWANKLDFDIVKDAIAPLVGKRKIYSIGNSMGGFNSIISTHYVPTEVCVAFVPQYSVNPSIVPWEGRWKEHTSNIKKFRFDSVREYMSNTTDYFIFSGGNGPDRRHAHLFPVKSNIRHYSFPSIAHNVSKRLKEMGVLDNVVQSCFDRASDLPQSLEYDILSPKSI